MTHFLFLVCFFFVCLFVFFLFVFFFVFFFFAQTFLEALVLQQPALMHVGEKKGAALLIRSAAHSSP